MSARAINENVAARLNAFYEKSDTFRDYGKLERYGFNPTMTFKPDDTTKIKLSYEYYHDERTADRGNPSQGLSAVAPSSTRFNPAAPFAPNGDLTAFFGSPSLERRHGQREYRMAFIEHDFQNGLTVKNSTLFADYQKFYQNVYPGNGPLSGAVNPADTAFNRAAYNHKTNRDNAINQTDFVYKSFTGPVLHTIAFGTEFGRQTGIDFRNTGIFPNGTNTMVADPFNPTYFGPVTFIHHSTGSQRRRRHHGRLQQQISAQHPVGLCARHDRDHALLAADRRRRASTASTCRRSDQNTEYQSRPGRQQDIAARLP